MHTLNRFLTTLIFFVGGLALADPAGPQDHPRPRPKPMKLSPSRGGGYPIAILGDFRAGPQDHLLGFMVPLTPPQEGDRCEVALLGQVQGSSVKADEMLAFLVPSHGRFAEDPKPKEGEIGGFTVHFEKGGSAHFLVNKEDVITQISFDRTDTKHKFISLLNRNIRWAHSFSDVRL